MKVSFIGSGSVASNTAFLTGINSICNEIVLLDINEDFAKGKAIDLQQAFILNNNKVKIVGTGDYSYIKNSDAIVITAGVANKSTYVGREELLKINKGIIEGIADNLKKVIPQDEKQPLIIIVTNPLDIILKHFIDFGGFNKTKTIGSGNLLDTARLKYYISKEFNVEFDKIDSVAIGQHGAKMVYLLSQTKIDGLSFADYIKKNNISKDTIDDICKKATAGSSEIIKLLQKDGTIFGPAVSIYNLLDSYINDKEGIFPLSIYSNGEYGFKNVCFGCPTVLNKNGIKKILEYNISEEEKKLLAESVNFIDSFSN